MMRWILALLLVLNALTLAWQWDAFASWGYGPNTAREPERLSQQIRPDALKIESPAVAEQRMAAERAAAEAAAAAAPAASEASSPAAAPAPLPNKP
ncbi:MAG: hypothetical protein RLZZ134_228 [Pseudomonadota bacterium]